LEAVEGIGTVVAQEEFCTGTVARVGSGKFSIQLIGFNGSPDYLSAEDLLRRLTRSRLVRINRRASQAQRAVSIGRDVSITDGISLPQRATYYGIQLDVVWAREARCSSLTIRSSGSIPIVGHERFTLRIF